MSIEVLISVNGFCYDVTIKLYKKSNACCGHVPDAINVLDVFVAVTQVFQLLPKHTSAALPCKRFVNKRL